MVDLYLLIITIYNYLELISLFEQSRSCDGLFRFLAKKAWNSWWCLICYNHVFKDHLFGFLCLTFVTHGCWFRWIYFLWSEFSTFFLFCRFILQSKEVIHTQLLEKQKIAEEKIKELEVSFEWSLAIMVDFPGKDDLVYHTEWACTFCLLIFSECVRTVSSHAAVSKTSPAGKVSLELWGFWRH